MLCPFYGRGLIANNGLKTPPTLPAFANRAPVCVCRQLGIRGRCGSWVHSTVGNPLPEICQHGFLELRTRLGHLEIVNVVSNALQEKALFRLPGDDDRFPRITAHFPTRPGIEVKTAFVFCLLRMALIAFLGQNRPDSRFKKLDLFGRVSVDQTRWKTQNYDPFD